MRAARFDSTVRSFLEMFLRARRALKFSHSQDPKETLACVPWPSLARQACCPAASKINRVISSGCEISERWLAFTSMDLAPKLRQGRQGNVIVEVLLDVVPHLVLLPTGKSAAKELSGARSPG